MHICRILQRGVFGAAGVAGILGDFRLRKWWIAPLLVYYLAYMLTEVVITVTKHLDT